MNMVLATKKGSFSQLNATFNLIWSLTNFFWCIQQLATISLNDAKCIWIISKQIGSVLWIPNPCAIATNRRWFIECHYCLMRAWVRVTSMPCGNLGPMNNTKLTIKWLNVRASRNINMLSASTKFGLYKYYTPNNKKSYCLANEKARVKLPTVYNSNYHRVFLGQMRFSMSPKRRQCLFVR